MYVRSCLYNVGVQFWMPGVPLQLEVSRVCACCPGEFAGWCGALQGCHAVRGLGEGGQVDRAEIDLGEPDL